MVLFGKVKGKYSIIYKQINSLIAKKLGLVMGLYKRLAKSLFIA